MGVLTKRFELTRGAQEYPRLSDWGRATWSRRRLILLLFFLFLLFTAAALKILPVTYRAQAILEVLPGRQPNAPAEPITSAAADEIRLNTEAEKVGADPVVRTVFKAWEAGRFGPTQGRAGEFRQTIDAFANLIRDGIGRLCRSPAVVGILSPLLCPVGANDNEQEARFVAFQGHLKVTAQRESRLIKVAFTAPILRWPRR